MRFFLLTTLTAIALTGCQFSAKREKTEPSATQQPTKPSTAPLSQEEIEKQRAEAEKKAQAPSNHKDFRGQSSWRGQTYRNEALIAGASPSNVRIEISINEQRGILLVNNEVAMDFPVATGRPTYPTPPGNYAIREKREKYSSNLYGKFVATGGSVISSDANTKTMSVPSGARFIGSPMPNWMRLTDTGVGMHIGNVPVGRPASHGCIRLKKPTALTLFKLTRLGTPVTIAYGMPSLGTGSAKPTAAVAPRPRPASSTRKPVVAVQQLAEGGQESTPKPAETSPQPSENKEKPEPAAVPETPNTPGDTTAPTEKTEAPTTTPTAPAPITPVEPKPTSPSSTPE